MSVNKNYGQNGYERVMENPGLSKHSQNFFFFKIQVKEREMDSKEENREQRHSLSHHSTHLSLFLLFLLVLDKFVSYYCLIKKDNFRVGWWFEIISVQ